MPNDTRLDKFLADAGLGTRSEVKKLLRAGRITIDGKSALKGEAKVTGEEDIRFDGKPVLAGPTFVYYLLHKPAGTLSATQDRHAPTVLDLLPKDARRNLFPVGRLDKDTEGLLLVTDDGAFAHALLSPNRHVDKTYYARVRPAMEDADIPRFREGLDIGDDKPTMPARLVIQRSYEVPPEEEEKAYVASPEGSHPATESEVLITIQEGRFHQVKRMVEAVGKEVRYLKRLSMGPFTLPEDLPVGKYILLEDPYRELS